MTKRLTLIALNVIFVMSVTFGIAEIFLRMTEGHVTPSMIKKNSLSYEPAVFARNVLPLKDQRSEAFSWSISSRGHRGKFFEEQKPEGATRIMVYGGSAVFDRDAIDDNDWPTRVERSLQSATVRSVEVINAGIPGHSSADSFGRLFAEGHMYRPDFTILSHAWNDIKDFTDEKSLLRKRKPYVPESDFRTQYYGPLDAFFGEHSALYNRFRFLYFVRNLSLGAEGRIPGSGAVKPLSPAALKQFRINIEMFIDLSRNIGAKPILLLQPRLVVKENTVDERKLIRYDFQGGMSHEQLVDAFERLDSAIRSVSVEKKVPLIDFSDQMNGKKLFFNDHVHVSEAGSEKLASLLAQELRLSLVK